VAWCWQDSLSVFGGPPSSSASLPMSMVTDQGLTS
jgi:hypothetical protein